MNNELQLQRQRQEEIQTNAQQQTRISEQYMQVDTFESQRLQRELMQGPPEELGKFARARWSREKQEQLRQQQTVEAARLREKELFCAPAWEMLEGMTGEIRKLRQTNEETPDALELAFSQCMGEPLSVSGLVREQEQLPPQVKALGDILETLGGCTPQTLTQETAAELVERYHGLGMEVGAVSVTHLDKTAAMDPASCYVLLYHCASVMLEDTVDKLPAEQVDIKKFARLRALAALSGLAAGTLCINRQFLETKSANETELERQAAEQEQTRQEEKLTEESRLKYLENGIGTDGEAPENWILAPYAKLAAEIFGAELAKDDWKTFARKVYDLEKKLELNLPVLERLADGEKTLTMGIPALRNAALEKVKQRLGTRLLTDDLEDSAELHRMFEQAAAENGELLTRCRQRRERLGAMDGIAELSHALELPEVQYIISAEDGEELFLRRAESLSRQATENLAQARSILAATLSTVSRQTAETELIKSEGKVLLAGSPAGVAIATEQFLRHLSVRMPEAAEKEKSFREAMRLAGIGADWLALAEARVKGLDLDDTERLDAELVELKQLIDTNLAAFDAASAELKLLSDDWKTLEQWKNEKLGSAPEQFARELSAQLGQLTKDAPGALLQSEYLFGEQAEKLKAKRPEPGVAEKALRGEALCAWEGIAEAYAGSADDIMAALEALLSKGNLPYPEAAGIGSLAQLDTLQRQQFSALAGRLRANLGVVAQAWKDMHCANEQELKKRLLPEMLCGKLTQEGFDAQAQKLAQQLLDEKEAMRRRFSLALGGAGKTQGEVKYRYLDARKGSAVLTNTSRCQRRVDRLEQADRIWEQLRALGLEKDARELCRTEETGKALGSKLKTLVESTPNGEKLAELLEKLPNDDYAAELRIAGYEDVAMQQSELSEALTVLGRNEYKRVVRKSGKSLRTRETNVLALLETRGVAPAEQSRLMRSLRELIGGIEPLSGEATQEQKERNLSRFGVQDWDEALGMIEKNISPEALENARSEAQMLSMRISYLHDLRGGMLQPLEESLLRDPELWRCLSGGTELAYKELLEQKADKLEKPLRALRMVGGNEGFLQTQILLECEDQFLTKDYSFRKWYDICRDTYEQISQHKIGNSSIADSFTSIIGNQKGLYGAMRPYLTAIVLAEGMDFLKTGKTAETVLKRYQKNVAPNEAALNEFLAGAAETETTKTGFRQFLLTKIVFSETGDFESGLGRWLTQFKELESETKRSVRQAHKEMDRRTAVMCEVEQHKEAGRQAEAPDAQLLEKLRRAPSPLLSALGRQDAPDAKEISKAREQVEKAFEQCPSVVKDCLTERVLSGLSADQMEDTAQALTELHRKICDMEFSGRTLSSSGASAFFTYVFAKDGANELSPALIQARFDEFAEKRRLLSEIAALQTDDPVIQTECRLLEDTMGTAMFTMETEDYRALLTRRLDYLRAETQAGAVMEELLAQETPMHKAKLKMGLRDYFHAELLAGSAAFNAVEFRARVSKLLEDETVKQYLEDSTSLLSAVSWDGLQSTEITSMTLLDRRGMESFLEEHAKDKLLSAYSALDVAQRQIFAMALTAPGGAGAHSELPSRLVLQNEKTRKSALIGMQTELQAYIKQEDFAPQVNYTLALTRLQTADGELDEEAFNQALAFTNLCISRRQEGIPTDYSRLADGRESLEAVRRISRQKGDRAAPSDVIPEPKSMDELFTQLREADGEQAAAVKERLSGLSGSERQLLVRALQDRTNLDYTTRVTMLDRGDGKVQSHVNEQQRQAFLDWYADSDTKEISSPVNDTALKQAMVSLFSYQIRDDADLSCRSLREEDIVGFARKTAVDWSLLERAMDFVSELEQSRLRLQAVKQAPALIEKSENEPAIELYHQHKDSVETEEDFSAFLTEQAQKDGQMALLGGFLALEEREKRLFLKALGSRDVLDVSKEGIMANRFGFGERDYVNPRARYALIDDYLRSSRGKEGLPIEEGDCHKALISLLSTQVSDDADFTGDVSLDKKLTSAALFKSPRETAVDWKLMQRALQLVSRTGNERSIFLEDRELYAAYGDMSRNGGFSFDGDYLRQNLHSAGNRFSRFFGRRAVGRISEAIPGPLKTMVRALLPVEMANQVNELFAEEEEEQSLLEKGNDFLESVSDFYKDTGKEKLERFVSKETADALGEKLETASEHLGYVTSGISLAQNIVSYGKLANAKKEAKQAEEPEENETLTEAEKTLVLSAKERNEHLQKQGSDKASQRQTDEIVKTVSEIAGGLISDAVGDESGIIEAAVQEAGELVNFLRSWFNDKKSVKDYFSRSGDAERIRAGLRERGLPEPESKDDIELLRQAKGFENYTEMASFVGLNIARSMVFCAGRYNPMKSTRILAIATLSVLGLEDCVGKEDSATAQKVYDAMMGGEYR